MRRARAQKLTGALCLAFLGLATSRSQLCRFNIVLGHRASFVKFILSKFKRNLGRKRRFSMYASASQGDVKTEAGPADAFRAVRARALVIGTLSR